MAVKLLKTIRLDRSDTFVFERAAEPGEWAVPGAFMFWNAETAGLKGKAQQAFRSGFLGLSSFGWSTLASVVHAKAADEQEAVAQLAEFLMREHGAPDRAAADCAAGEELAFAASLCDHPVGTLIALQRSVDSDGQIRERFRTLKPASTPRAQFEQAWVRPISIVADEDQQAGDEPPVDLVDLARPDPAGKSRP